MLSGVFMSLSSKLASQPGASKTPVAFRRGVGQADYPRRLVNRQVSEKAQLDNPAMLRIGRRQFLQSVVEREQLHFWFVTEALSLSKRQPQLLAAAFAAPRIRAWSTRMSRMIFAARPK